MINTVISSSVLIFIILAIRRIFKGKINPVVQYSLWGLVVLRLTAFVWLDLHPIKSAFSVMNVTGGLSEALRGAAATSQVLAGTGQAGIMENAVFIMDNVKTGVTVSGAGISPMASIDWQLAFLVIWVIGALVMGFWFGFVNLRFSRQLVENRTFLMFVEADRKGKSSDYLSVYTAEGLDSPCLMGHGGETAIYVTPEVAADKEMLRYAVFHELCHYRHYDLIWSFVRGGLLTLYWFHPLVWAAAVMSKRDCELACDYEVVKRIGDGDRLAYGKALVDLISRGRQKGHILQMATTMCGGAKGIKERVVMIAGNKKMKVSTLIAVLVIAALSAGCTFTAAAERGDVSGGASEPIPSQVNQERLVIIDPGHGGADLGAVFTDAGDEITEKDLNLKVAYLLCDMLKDSGVNVEMTRQDDREMSLEERMEPAGKPEACLFLSIHFENSPNALNTAIAQYTPSLGEKGAGAICAGLKESLGLESTEIKKMDEILKFSRLELPAMIIDMPFISGESGKERFSADEYALKTAETLHGGIVKALDEI